MLTPDLAVTSIVLYHPYVAHSTQPLVDFLDKHDIVFEGYSGLIPLTSQKGGPVDKPVDAIAKRLNLAPEQVLLAWSRAKGYAHVVSKMLSPQRTGADRRPCILFQCRDCHYLVQPRPTEAVP